MVTFLVLSDLVILVVGILQIILFFKIWGMTNDVRALKKKFTLSPASLSTSEVLKESYKGNPELPNFLFDAVYKDMEAVWNNRAESVYDQQTPCWVENNEVVMTKNGEAAMTKRITEIKDRYKDLYARVNIPFPAVFDAISSAGDFGKAFSK